MSSSKLTPSRLESLLTTDGNLRVNMEASEYQECVFGMLFLKRASDLRDQRREEVKANGKAWMPRKHKKANPMFVQRVLAVLKAQGRPGKVKTTVDMADRGVVDA